MQLLKKFIRIKPALAGFLVYGVYVKDILNDDLIFKVVLKYKEDYERKLRINYVRTWHIRLRLQELFPYEKINTRKLRQKLKDMEKRGLLTSINENGNNIGWRITDEEYIKSYFKDTIV